MISHAYDEIFAWYGAGIPVPYLRALSEEESNQNPNDTKGSYWGLMQVGWRGRNSVLAGYNKRHGTHYTSADLLNSVLNVKIGGEAIRRIVTSYEKNHPNAPNMQEDWRNPEFVRLVTAGWNSGYSERGGVGRTAHYLERHGIPVTHANVFKYAAAAGATRHLQNPAKEGWQHGVVKLYFEQPDIGTVPGRRRRATALPFLFVAGRPGVVATVLVVFLGGLAAALVGRDKEWW